MRQLSSSSLAPGIVRPMAATVAAPEETQAETVHIERATTRRSTRPAGAIVIGGDYRGLGIVRSLGRQGVPVWVLTDEHKLAGASRYAQRSISMPLGSDENQARFLIELCDRERLDGWALFPTGDEAAAMVARNEERLGQRFCLTTPSWETMRWAYDKRLTHQLAIELGIDHARTAYPASRDDILALECEFPVIIKPAIKIGPNQLTTAKAWQVGTHEELLKRYDEACTLVQPEWITVQDLIPGGGEHQFSFAGIARAGRPIATIAARRTRQYPMDFGRASTYVETIDYPEMEEISLRILERLDYDGLFEVEYKRDPRTGRLNLLDINARAWGWHSLGRRAGTDFPYLLWQFLQGQTLPPMRAAAGVRWVRMTTDFPTVIKEIRGGRLPLRSYLRSLRRPIEFAIFAPDDPMPGIVEIPLIAQLIWQRGST